MHLLSQQPLGTHLYVCGPEAMIDAVLQFGKEAGWPRQHLHAERFTALRGGFPFTVQLARSERSVAIKEDESILQALEFRWARAAVSVPGRRLRPVRDEGFGVRRNAIQHNDHYLSDDEKMSGKKIMICCSRVRGASVTLDL